MQKTHSGVGAATVYRNLPILVKAGVLRESLNDLEGQMIYEVEWQNHHDHIICVDCDEIIEFYDPEMEKKQDNVLSKLKFEDVSHRHVIYAKCKFRKSK